MAGAGISLEEMGGSARRLGVVCEVLFFEPSTTFLAFFGILFFESCTSLKIALFR
jgi:hypothetical protein